MAVPKPRRNKNGDLVLDLSRKNYTTLPADALTHPGIDVLTLCENRLTVLPAAASTFRSLRVLDLCKNYMETFPAPVLQMQQLKSLDLSFNKLSSISKEIKGLVNLTVLLLSHNSFKRFPDEVCLIKKLDTLDISYNAIDHIPPSIAQLQTLTELNASNNKIAEISDEIYGNRRLNIIDLSNNQLERLPPLICIELSKLSKLSLTGNDLREPPKDVCDKGVLAVREYQQLQRQRQATGTDRSLGPARSLHTRGGRYPLRKGLVVIICNDKFATREARPGAAVDRDRIKDAFKRYPFEMQVFNDLKGDEMLFSLKLLRKMEQEFDCLIVFLLGHGTLSTSLGSDGKCINLREIVQVFSSESCPRLAGKPKLFFQQCFQADANDPGQFTLPSEDDFMFGSSMIPTLEGYRVATQKSSPYIEAMCRFIKEEGASNHVAEIMTMVADEMKTRVYTVKGQKLKMNTVLFGTLTKQLWLK